MDAITPQSKFCLHGAGPVRYPTCVGPSLFRSLTLVGRLWTVSGDKSVFDAS